MGHARLVIGYSVLALIAAGCKDYGEPMPFDPKALQKTSRDAAKSFESQLLNELPNRGGIYSINGASTRPTFPASISSTLNKTPSIRLTLQECIQRAVASNLEVRVAGYAPAIDATRTVESEARFDPTFFMNVQGQNQYDQTAGSPTNNFSNQVINRLPISDKDIQEIYTFQGGFKQNLPTGGQAELRQTITRSDFDPQRFSLNPFVEYDLTLQLTQPLLRDFGTEVNQARISISRNNTKISLLDFRKSIEDTVDQIEETYWQLFSAIELVRIQEELLAQTYKTADVLRNRLGVDANAGTLYDTLAKLSTRRQNLYLAENDVRRLSNKLLQLMNDPDMPTSTNVLIFPASAPVEEALKFDFDDLVNVALEQRLELAQQIYRIDSAAVTTKAAKNNVLPQLNFVGSAGWNGVQDGFDTAFGQFANVNHPAFGAGLQFEVPLGNRAARAILRRTLLQYAQSIDQYRSFIEQVTLDVKNAINDVETRWQALGAARESTFYNEDTLRAQLARVDNKDPLTPNTVRLILDTQDNLAQARRAEAEARSTYNVAVSKLEKAKGTLLRYNNILMEEEPIKRQLAR